MTDKDKRFILVGMWTFALFSFQMLSQMMGHAIFRNDLWTADRAPANGLAMLDDSTKGQLSSHIIVFRRDEDKPDVIHAEEAQTRRASISLDSAETINISSGWIGSRTAKKLFSMSVNQEVSQRFSILETGPPSHAQETIDQYRNSVNWTLGVLTFVLLLLMFAWPLYADVSRAFPHLTVLSAIVIGVVQSMLIAMQGGVLVSPLGFVQGVALPILASQALFAAKRRSPEQQSKRVSGWWRVIYWLPFAVFLIGTVLGHMRALQLSSEGVRELLSRFYAPFYIPFYLAAMLFGVLSVATRAEPGTAAGKQTS